MRIAIAKVRITKDVFGEWIVLAYNAKGVRMPKADYFTDDLADAKATAQAMLNPEERSE